MKSPKTKLRWNTNWLNGVLTKRQMTTDQRIFGNQKIVCLNRYIWSLCSKFQCMSTENNFHFSVNRKMTLMIAPKKLPFLVDLRQYWLKVPNIKHTYLSIQNIHLPLLWDFLSGTCWKKFPMMYKVLSQSPRLTMCHKSCLKVYFHSVNVNVCGLDSPNFCTYLSIQNV